MPIDEFFEANRANWDDRAVAHWAEDAYDPESFARDSRKITDVVQTDRARVGDVTGKSLVHLQCHIGTDTLSWARLGARVTGVDFSEESIAAARRLAEMAGLDARFVLSNVYQAHEVLTEQFEIVYTSVGAINWLPDIRRWADVVDRLLAPGGVFYIRDGHPMLMTLDWDLPALTAVLPYFETDEPAQWDSDETYLGSGKIANTRCYDWNHALSETMTALLDVGLVIEAFEEYRFCEWQAHVSMVDIGNGRWAFLNPDLCPTMFSIRARKPK